MKDKIDRTRKLNEFIHSQADSFVTWIIGFSFTGLLLLVANLDKLKAKPPTKPIVIFLFISIILGITFRIISFLITIFQKSLDDYFYGLLSEQEMTPIYLEEELNKLEFLDLLSLIKEDFDIVIYPEANASVNLPKICERMRKGD